MRPPLPHPPSAHVLHVPHAVCTVRSLQSFLPVDVKCSFANLAAFGDCQSLQALAAVVDRPEIVAWLDLVEEWPPVRIAVACRLTDDCREALHRGSIGWVPYLRPSAAISAAATATSVVEEGEGDADAPGVDEENADNTKQETSHDRDHTTQSGCTAALLLQAATAPSPSPRVADPTEGSATARAFARDVAALWAPYRHRLFHPQFRSRVRLLLLMVHRRRTEVEERLELPPELWLSICSWMVRNDWPAGLS